MCDSARISMACADAYIYIVYSYMCGDWYTDSFIMTYSIAVDRYKDPYMSSTGCTCLCSAEENYHLQATVVNVITLHRYYTLTVMDWTDIDELFSSSFHYKEWIFRRYMFGGRTQMTLRYFTAFLLSPPPASRKRVQICKYRHFSLDTHPPSRRDVMSCGYDPLMYSLWRRNVQCESSYFWWLSRRVL